MAESPVVGTTADAPMQPEGNGPRPCSLTVFVALPVGVVVTVLGLRLTRVLGATETEVLGRMPIIGRFAGLVGRAA